MAWYSIYLILVLGVVWICNHFLHLAMWPILIGFAVGALVADVGWWATHR